MPGRKQLPCVDHRQLVEQLRVPDAGHLVGGLEQLGRTHHIGRIRPLGIGQRPQDRMRLVVDADAGARREMIGDRRGEQLDAVVEIREQWTVHMVVRQVVWHPVAVHRVQVRRRISLHHNGNRAEQRGPVAVLARLGGTRRIGDRARTEQHQSVDTLRVELVLQPSEPFAPHPGDVGHRRDRPPADRCARRPIVDGSTSLRMQR